jgi:hypothetical protein
MKSTAVTSAAQDATDTSSTASDANASETAPPGDNPSATPNSTTTAMIQIATCGGLFDKCGGGGISDGSNSNSTSLSSAVPSSTDAGAFTALPTTVSAGSETITSAPDSTATSVDTSDPSNPSNLSAEDKNGGNSDSSSNIQGSDSNSDSGSDRGVDSSSNESSDENTPGEDGFVTITEAMPDGAAGPTSYWTVMSGTSTLVVVGTSLPQTGNGASSSHSGGDSSNKVLAIVLPLILLPLILGIILAIYVSALAFWFCSILTFSAPSPPPRQ